MKTAACLHVGILTSSEELSCAMMHAVTINTHSSMCQMQAVSFAACLHIKVCDVAVVCCIVSSMTATQVY